jgi:hypothetical protein
MSHARRGHPSPIGTHQVCAVNMISQELVRNGDGGLTAKTQDIRSCTASDVSF